MKFTQHKSTIRTVRQNDPDFRIQDGFVSYPRAGFHILPECPAGYRQVIEECVRAGWLKPVAHMHDYELMWDRLHE